MDGGLAWLSAPRAISMITSQSLRQPKGKEHDFVEATATKGRHCWFRLVGSKDGLGTKELRHRA
jgi:hypothetical protein